jgi:arylsulfatase A-like enzyme
VFVDDLGYADLGVYGSGSAPAGAPWKAWDSLPIKTPRLDQMAAAGVRFTSFYSGSPTCTRSRAGLLTGSYAMRVGFPDGVLTPASAVGLNPNEVTLPTLLKARGYRTAMFGKWHLGHKPKFLPTAHGFDEYMGVPYSNDMAIDPDMTLAAGVVLGKDLTGQDWTAQRILALKGATKEERDRLDADQVPLLRGTEVVEYPVDQSTLTRRYTDEAIRFMSENKAHPFFIYVPHSMPHTPLHPSAEFAGKSARGKYGDVVEELDFHVGRLLDAVKDQGLESNTLVVFTSDNGPWAAKGIDGGTAYPFNGAKFSTWEGGMRVPAIMRWPGQIASGLVQDEPASVIDLYPTLAKLTGGDVPPNRVTDGEDIWPIVTGQAGANHGPFYYDLSAIRDGNWKLRHDVVGDGGQLYDLSKDPHEDSDLSASNAQVKQMLQAQLDKFKAELEANKRPVGTNDTQVLPKGCTNKAAPNYNATAQIDDGSCGVQ